MFNGFKNSFPEKAIGTKIIAHYCCGRGKTKQKDNGQQIQHMGRVRPIKYRFIRSLHIKKRSKFFSSNNATI